MFNERIWRCESVQSCNVRPVTSQKHQHDITHCLYAVFDLFHKLHAQIYIRVNSSACEVSTTLRLRALVIRRHHAATDTNRITRHLWKYPQLSVVHSGGTLTSTQITPSYKIYLNTSSPMHEIIWSTISYINHIPITPNKLVIS